MRPRPPIVVAVPDGDDEALLRFAAWEALVHGCAVHLVRVRTGRHADDAAEAQRVLADAIARTEIVAGPGVLVTGTVVTGVPVASVLRVSGDCLGVVVRHRDALHLMRAVEEDGRPGGDPPLACVPTAWVASDDDDRPVLVGVDDPGHARTLIVRALRIAHDHGTSLRVLHAWRFHRQYDNLIDARIGERWSADVREALAEIVEECRSDLQSEVPVDIVVEHGSAAEVLIAAAEKAQTLVLQRNSHHLGPEHMGRTTRAALHQCPCPVVLLPSGPPGR